MKKGKVKYAYINQKIEDDESLDKTSKKTLKEYNKKIVELVNHGISNFSTIVSNSSSIPKRKFIEYIRMIFDEYNLVDEVEEFKRFFSDDEYDNCLLIIKDDNMLKKAELDSMLKTLYKSNVSVLLFTNEDKNYYKSICKDQLEIERLIEISNNKVEEKDYYKYLINKYDNNNIQYELTNDQFDKVIKIFKEKTDYNGLELINFIYDYSIKVLKNNKKRVITTDLLNCCEEKKKENIDLDKMIGLKNVKKQISDIRNYLEFRRKSKINLDNLSLNMFLTGNSGTGKTTIARMLGSIFYEFGLLESDEVVLVTASRLTGEHVGETKNVTTRILNQAKGKLLCIDEAYGLYNPNYKNNNNPYNDEAIEILLDYLNDPKNIVMFCGYKKEMQELYKANPGIKSRIYKEIEFEDYSTQELMEILKEYLTTQGLKIGNDVEKDLEDYIDECKKKENFGNARFIKNKLAQDLIINHSNRRLKKENFTIEKEDLPEFVKERGVGLV